MSRIEHKPISWYTLHIISGNPHLEFVLSSLSRECLNKLENLDKNWLVASVRTSKAWSLLWSKPWNAVKAATDFFSDLWAVWLLISGGKWLRLLDNTSSLKENKDVLFAKNLTPTMDFFYRAFFVKIKLRGCFIKC